MTNENPKSELSSFSKHPDVQFELSLAVSKHGVNTPEARSFVLFDVLTAIQKHLLAEPAQYALAASANTRRAVMSKPAKNPALLGAFLLVFAISLGVLGGFKWFMLSHAHRIEQVRR